MLSGSQDGKNFCTNSVNQHIPQSLGTPQKAFKID